MTTILDLVTIVAPYVAVFSALLILWVVNIGVFDVLKESILAAAKRHAKSNRLIASERRWSEANHDDGLQTIRMFRRQRVASKTNCSVSQQAA